MTTRKQAIEDLRMFSIKEPQTYLVNIIPLIERIESLNVKRNVYFVFQGLGRLWRQAWEIEIWRHASNLNRNIFSFKIRLILYS